MPSFQTHGLQAPETGGADNSGTTLSILKLYLDISGFLWGFGKEQSSHLEQSPPRQNRYPQLLCNMALLLSLHGHKSILCLRHETDYPVLYPCINSTESQDGLSWKGP